MVKIAVPISKHKELLTKSEIFRRLDWDSDFFGFQMGRILSLPLTPPMAEDVDRIAKDQNMDFVEFLCPADDRKSMITAEKHHYRLADIRVTMEQDLEDMPLAPLPEGYAVRIAQDKDIPSFKDLAARLNFPSRYAMDENFDRSKVSEFYATWVSKAIQGQFDDLAYGLFHSIKCHGHARGRGHGHVQYLPVAWLGHVATGKWRPDPLATWAKGDKNHRGSSLEGNKAVGFCTIKNVNEKSARIGLFGVDAPFEGMGLAAQLLKTVLYEIHKTGVRHIQVVTQGRNEKSQRVFQKCGFFTKSTELWFHKWLKRRANSV